MEAESRRRKLVGPMLRRESRLGVMPGRRTAKTQRKVGQNRIRYWKFTAIAVSRRCRRMSSPSSHTAHVFNPSLNRDIDLSRVCPVRELLVKEDAPHKN